MLESLISGKESSPFVVIKDTLAAPGDNLLLVWSRLLRRRFAAVVALHCGTTNLGYETFAVHCLDDLQCEADPPQPSSILTRIQSHPLFPGGGESPSSGVSPSVAFVLPDLNSLFLFLPPSSVFSFLDSLLRLSPTAFLVGLVHRDCFPSSLLPSLDYLSRTSISLHPAPAQFRGAASSSSSSSSSSSTQDALSCLADVFHKKSSGKVLRSRQLVRLAASPPRLVASIDVAKLVVKADDPAMESTTATIDSTTTTTTKTKTAPRIAYEGVSTGSGAAAAAVNNDDGDPTANLTFSLSLSEREKSAREKVVLPFARKKTGQGKIIYEAEDEDDFDEEDPDDDLNI